MGDYSLCQGYLSGISGYGSGTTGSTYPRQAISSLTSTTTWGTGIAWDSVNLRVNITTSTYYVLVYASCHILSGTASTTVGLAVYKNGVQISTGSLGQYLGGTTAQPFPIHITWAGSVVNTDNIQIYLIKKSFHEFSNIVFGIFVPRTIVLILSCINLFFINKIV